MKTLSAVIVLAAVLVLPATAVAKPDASDKRAAIASCKAERGKTKATRHAFKAKYHSFRGCTHAKVVKVKTARRAAVGECKDERSDDAFPAAHEEKSFDDFYDSDDRGEGGFNDCVSTKVDEQETENEAGDDDAADEQEHQGGKCDDEHGSQHEQSDDVSDDSGSDD
jgi:hypothetical protein